MTTRNSKGGLSVIAVLSLILIAGGATASAQHHGHGGYGHYGYEHSYSPYYYSGYGPYGYSPYSGYGPYGYGRLGYYSFQGPTTGTLKFQVTPKTETKAQVYINDALASEFKHKRSLNLAPGEYRIKVRKEGYQSQSRIVRVTAGETLKLEFTLVPTAQPSNSELIPLKHRLWTAEGTPSHKPAGPMFLATRLSPSGSKLAIAAWSPGQSAGSIQLYTLENGEPLAFDRPSGTFGTEEEIQAVEWAPDGDRLFALTKPQASVAEPLQEIDAGIRVLDLRRGEWTTVETANLARGSLEVYGLETPSRAERIFLQQTPFVFHSLSEKSNTLVVAPAARVPAFADPSLFIYHRTPRPDERFYLRIR